jgi:hypothetical protein
VCLVYLMPSSFWDEEGLSLRNISRPGILANRVVDR